MKKYLILLFVFLSGSLIAQEDTTKLSDYYVDLSVPDLGISGLMDITSDNIYKPANFKDFAWQIYNDLEGKSGTGYAMEFPLSTFLPKESIDLNKYVERKGLFNTRLSFGFVNSESGLSLAAGFKMNFYNDADPYDNVPLREKISRVLKKSLRDREDELAAYRSSLDEIFDIESNTSLQDVIYNTYDLNSDDKYVTISKKKGLWKRLSESGSLISEDQLESLHIAFNKLVLARQKTDKQKEESIKTLKDEFSANHWNSKFFTLNYGILWNANDSKVSSLGYNRYQTVLALGQPVFGNFSQLILNAQFTGNIGGSTLVVDGGSDPLLDQRNKLFLGGRWLLKTNKVDKLVTGNLFVEGGYTETSFYNRDLEKVFVGLAGAEFRLLNKFWIQGGLGVSNDQGKFQFSLKQNIGEKSRF